MSDFLRALRSFDSGSLSQEQLLAEVDRQLASHRTDPVTILALLDEENARTALPPKLHEALSEKILGSLEVSTASGARAEPGDATEYFKEPEETVVIGLGDSQLRHAVSPGGASKLPPDASQPGAQPESPEGEDQTATKGSVLKHRFKLVGCVGEGGMGRVYKAIDLRRVEARAQNVYVAVKLLTKTFRDYSGSLALLQREASKLQTLPHPNIVRVIDCDRDGQTVFMTMEYLAGQPLKQKLSTDGSPGMTYQESMRVLGRIAEALSFAHRNDIVHGDLKPGNVIVTDSGEVKVIDFGIARAMAGSKRHWHPRNSGEFEQLSALTPSYASPEMLENQPPDPRDDVYALACMAHEMLTGTHPFERKASTVARDLGMKLVRRNPLSRTQFNALANGLQFDRDKRTPTVERFMQEFRGDRAATVRRTLMIAATATLAVASCAYVLDRMRSRSAGKSLAAGDIFRDCPTCPLMKVLPAGRFEQGSAEGETDAQAFEQPRHTVVIAKPVGFGVQEVTRGQFKEFVDATKPDLRGCASYDGAWTNHADLSWCHVGYPQSASHPVTCVSWLDATAYAKWLSGKTGQHYRLPSASEWEYAARAGTRADRPWGANTSDACAAANVADEAAAQRYPGWSVHACNDGYVYTAPVGAFAANAFGLSDMLGNVFEWVEDCWHENYRGAPTSGSAWLQGECKQHEMRGGSWFTTPAYVRAAYRNRFEEDYRSNSIGFRLVRELNK